MSDSLTCGSAPPVDCVNGDTIGTTEVEVELDEETLSRLEEKAFHDHRDSRAAAVSDLLDEWLKAQD